jgi:hypothetical protein
MTLALAKPVLIAPKGCTGMTVLERAQRYLSKCPPAISGEQGHKTTFRVACKLVHGFALSAANGSSRPNDGAGLGTRKACDGVRLAAGVSGLGLVLFASKKKSPAGARDV